jgi:energy-converting hydrogenase Eha subunit A
MEIVILVFVVIGALVAIASGIWVAIALGSAISKDDKMTSIDKEKP